MTYDLVNRERQIVLRLYYFTETMIPIRNHDLRILYGLLKSILWRGEWRIVLYLVLIENSMERFPIFAALRLPEVGYFIEAHPNFDKNRFLFSRSKTNLNQTFAKRSELLDTSGVTLNKEGS